MVNNSVEVISVVVDGMRNTLNLVRAAHSKSVVLLPSMEVYEQTEKSEVCEGDLGYINLTNPRSSYPESKRFCESLCTAYYKQFGISVKTARLARTFGGGVSRGDTRVFAQFARSAVDGTDRPYSIANPTARMTIR
ncbi:NAD-dependent epimerase/dehydratase family protein [Desulfitobacterium hafniense]|uniref:NAD-dependent epimerase/dehydratase family protein n=1 Tax=Desulfitobacterium hafniense TaxID=49338 RepID=UPI0013053FA5|nr:NAD-dependent epimerase/dehydratase family protein [Desulfitobacterium hafniense]